MDLYTSTDCWDDMSRARYTPEGAAIKKAECEALEAQEQAVGDAYASTTFSSPHIRPLGTSADCWYDMSRAKYTPEGAAIKKAECEALEAQEQANLPKEREWTTEEQFCKDEMNTMQWADVMPNPAKDNFYATCVDEQMAISYSEGDIEGIEEIEIEPQTAGFGDNKLLIWLVIGGAALWYMNKQGFLK